MGFIPSQSHIYEGQFTDGRLNGFARSIKADKSQAQIGFFKANQEHGYFKTTSNGVTTEGLFEMNVFKKNKQEIKEYDPHKDFIAQKILWKDYIIKMKPRIIGWDKSS